MTKEAKLTRRDFHSLATLLAANVALGFADIQARQNFTQEDIQELVDEVSRNHLRTVPPSELHSSSVGVYLNLIEPHELIEKNPAAPVTMLDQLTATQNRVITYAKPNQKIVYQNTMHTGGRYAVKKIEDIGKFDVVSIDTFRQLPIAWGIDLETIESNSDPVLDFRREETANSAIDITVYGFTPREGKLDRFDKDTKLDIIQAYDINDWVDLSATAKNNQGKIFAGDIITSNVTMGRADRQNPTAIEIDRHALEERYADHIRFLDTTTGIQTFTMLAFLLSSVSNSDKLNQEITRREFFKRISALATIGNLTATGIEKYKTKQEIQNQLSKAISEDDLEILRNNFPLPDLEHPNIAESHRGIIEALLESNPEDLTNYLVWLLARDLLSAYKAIAYQEQLAEKEEYIDLLSVFGSSHIYQIGLYDLDSQTILDTYIKPFLQMIGNRLFEIFGDKDSPESSSLYSATIYDYELTNEIRITGGKHLIFEDLRAVIDSIE